MERQVRKRRVTTTIDVPYIEIDSVERYDGYDSPITMNEIIDKLDENMWRTETYYVYPTRNGKVWTFEGKPYDEEEDDEYDGLFEFTKETAGLFVSQLMVEQRARVDQGRWIRLQATGNKTDGWLVGRAPCGSFFRLKRKEALKVGKAILDDYYPDPEPKEPFKTTEVS